MLVVTSNWCVSDASLSAGPSRGVLDRFRRELRRASCRAGMQADGRYRPVSAIAVVFAGDTFDWLTSREWTGTVRPWETGLRAARARERVAAASLRRARRLLATLAAWGRRGVEVPLADGRGRPLAGKGRRVPVAVAVLRGDRDRWIDAVLPAGSAVAAVVSTGATWTDGGVLVRHGEEIEYLWHDAEREPTLGESLAVDLIARFGALLHEVADVRPRVAAIMHDLVTGRMLDARSRLQAWLTAHGRDGTLSAAAIRSVGEAWQRAVDAWYRAAWRLDLGQGHGMDLLGLLAADLARRESDAADHGEPPRQSFSAPGLGGGRDAEGVTCEILGHPPVGFIPATKWRCGIECLGPACLARPTGREGPRAARGRAGLALLDPPGMIFRGAVGDESPVPAAAIVGRGPMGIRLDWLPIGGGAVPGPCDASPHGIVWHSLPADQEARIVDAA